MSWIAALLGALVALMGLLAVLAPDRVLSLVEWEARRWVWVAAGVRVAAGLVLLAAAAGSRAPGAMFAGGAIALVAGVATPLIRWWRDQRPGLYRMAGAVAISLGAFVLWANLP